MASFLDITNSRDSGPQCGRGLFSVQVRMECTEVEQWMADDIVPQRSHLIGNNYNEKITKQAGIGYAEIY